MDWISVKDGLPEVKPNTDGKPCAVISDSGNVYRARYMRDVYGDIDRDYWSKFFVNMQDKDVKDYEINEKIVYWAYLPSLDGK